jgi:hypothetical protein
MWAKLSRIYWRLLAWLRPEPRLLELVRRKAQMLKDQMEGKLTDDFVEVLFFTMEVAFILLASYRRNLRGFRGSIVLRTADQRGATSAVFGKEKMLVKAKAVFSPNVTVTFKDSAALCRFLFSKDQDILASLLANEVELDGNMNYIYKFGFMARDLTRRLGIA